MWTMRAIDIIAWLRTAMPERPRSEESTSLLALCGDRKQRPMIGRWGYFWDTRLRWATASDSARRIPQLAIYYQAVA